MVTLQQDRDDDELYDVESFLIVYACRELNETCP